MNWPYPGDSPVTVARRVAWSYRQRLHEISPADARQLDEIMMRFGQQWATPAPIPTDPDAWLTAATAAQLAGISVGSIGNLRRAGRLHGRQVSDRKWQYQVREILALSAHPRTRQKRQTSDVPQRAR